MRAVVFKGEHKVGATNPNVSVDLTPSGCC